MSKNIGIVCEGPTDYILLKGLIDRITGEDNQYVQLQPESNLIGEYGNGWKGVWKWCIDHAEILEKFMKEVIPRLDILIVQMDGDVARKEKEVHCLCETTVCEIKETDIPLNCSKLKNGQCPVKMPCTAHSASAEGYINHLTDLISGWLNRLDDVCIVVPCDSTDTWVVAAYDKPEEVESLQEPWENVISRGKTYHDIRIPGHKKRLAVYRQFANKVCDEWEDVKRLCISAKIFDEKLKLLNKKGKEHDKSGTNF